MAGETSRPRKMAAAQAELRNDIRTLLSPLGTAHILVERGGTHQTATRAAFERITRRHSGKFRGSGGADDDLEAVVEDKSDGVGRLAEGHRIREIDGPCSVAIDGEDADLEADEIGDILGR